MSRVLCATIYTFWYSNGGPWNNANVASALSTDSTRFRSWNKFRPILLIEKFHPSRWETRDPSSRPFPTSLSLSLSLSVCDGADWKSHTICQISTGTRPTTSFHDYTSRRRVWRSRNSSVLSRSSARRPSNSEIFLRSQLSLGSVRNSSARVAKRGDEIHFARGKIY